MQRPAKPCTPVRFRLQPPNRVIMNAKKNSYKYLKKFALDLRIFSLICLYHAKSGHPGGCLSLAEIVSYIWNNELQYSDQISLKRVQNRLILSKGHSVPILYAAGYLSGLYPYSQLKTLRKINSKLQGHPHVLNLPWLETSTGSLGQGLSFSVGMAMACQYKEIDENIYCIVGDGEMQEGMIWESLMSAAHYKLNKLCIILDYNKLQSDDLNSNIMNIEPLKDKLLAFGLNVKEIDGHNLVELGKAIKNFKTQKAKPTFIIAHTIKGKGISFMESIPKWHGSVELTLEQLKDCMNELDYKGEYE